MSNSEEDCRNMLEIFRNYELQILLGSFGFKQCGRKSKLKEQALEILRNKTLGVNHETFLAKIVEIYHSMTSNVGNNKVHHTKQNQKQQITPMNTLQAQPTKVYLQPVQFVQRTIPVQSARLPQIMPKIQRDVHGNSISIGGSGSNTIQRRYQQTGSLNTVPQISVHQQANTVSTDYLTQNKSNTNTINTIPSSHSLAYVKIKKMAFFDVISDLIKPFILVGHDKCSLPVIPNGMREVAFKVTLSPEQATSIAMNRDLSDGKNEYIYQLRLRIYHLKSNCTEITDYLPLGLRIRINNTDCELPPTPPNKHPGNETRRIAQSIDCTQLFKLNPSISNTLIVNWIPDKKKYVMALYFAKKLSSEFLLEKLIEKKPSSIKETRRFIKNKLIDVDPDLATTSFLFCLICPIGKSKIKIPTKSINCEHLQCFDAYTFILMNEKKPNWTCPICRQPCSYDDLQIESYFLDVISSPLLPADCTEIELLANGTWKVCENNVKLSKISNDVEGKFLGTINLDSSDDENDMEAETESDPNPENPKELNNFDTCLIDLTISDDEEPLKEKDIQENEAQAADAVQPITKTELKSLDQIQPQQTVTSSEQEMVIEIDCVTAPPTSPMPATETS